MRRDGKYRFSLQFSDDTIEGRKAGELLENYGNRKSMIIVAALNEYLEAHPELNEENCSIRVSVTPVASPDELERMVRRVVEERISGHQFQSETKQKYPLCNSSDTGMDAAGNQVEQTALPDEGVGGEDTILKELEADVSQMLDNLDFFQ